MAESDDHMVWIDLEMTGLDISRDRIIEIATLITDPDLQVVAEGPELVVHQPESLLAQMDEWNQQHHKASGLVDRVRQSTTSEADAEAQTLSFLQAHIPKGAPLAGNSVHMDRLFLSHQMPSIVDYLHYRIVDVSTVKELVRRWYPQHFDKRPTKKGNHRALDDIRESVEELRFYRRTAFASVEAK